MIKKSTKDKVVMNINEDNKPYLIAHAVPYYGPIDEDLFFQWIRRIICIERYDGSVRDLYLHLRSANLTEDDLFDLLYFFKRYDIDMKQLRPFLNSKNKTHFKKCKDAYWYEPLFGR